MKKVAALAALASTSQALDNRQFVELMNLQQQLLLDNSRVLMNLDDTSVDITNNGGVTIDSDGTITTGTGGTTITNTDGDNTVIEDGNVGGGVGSSYSKTCTNHICTITTCDNSGNCTTKTVKGGMWMNAKSVLAGVALSMAVLSSTI
eukprot:CAMPEP_0170481944 /NCGR_PEP_ID=MMETSP0208-20121228/2188_1 /TAXON_ID=197538 /ORGANISM="Strombidium inclinatum, Strain S3" /LENGTH=147 /DNA_ID=CAMNT_0010754735 /DNA_START=42 /DNA_END=485 /DNA_ORIENTATION=-